jgi:hypothetical protein
MEIVYKAGLPAHWTIVPYDEMDFHAFENISTGVKFCGAGEQAQPCPRFVFASRPGNIAIDNEAYAG